MSSQSGRKKAITTLGRLLKMDQAKSNVKTVPKAEFTGLGDLQTVRSQYDNSVYNEILSHQVKNPQIQNMLLAGVAATSDGTPPPAITQENELYFFESSFSKFVEAIFSSILLIS